MFPCASFAVFPKIEPCDRDFAAGFPGDADRLFDLFCAKRSNLIWLKSSDSPIRKFRDAYPFHDIVRTGSETVFATVPKIVVAHVPANNRFGIWCERGG